jgi:hypothetical protein
MASNKARTSLLITMADLSRVVERKRLIRISVFYNQIPVLWKTHGQPGPGRMFHEKYVLHYAPLTGLVRGGVAFPCAPPAPMHIVTHSPFGTVLATIVPD